MPCFFLFTPFPSRIDFKGPDLDPRLGIRHRRDGMLGAGAGLSAGKRVQQRHFPDLRPVRSLTAVANEPRRGGPIGKLHTLGAGAIVAHAVRAAVGEGAPSLSVLSASAQTARRNGAL